MLERKSDCILPMRLIRRPVERKEATPVPLPTRGREETKPGGRGRSTWPGCSYLARLLPRIEHDLAAVAGQLQLEGFLDAAHGARVGDLLV